MGSGIARPRYGAAAAHSSRGALARRLFPLHAGANRAFGLAEQAPTESRDCDEQYEGRDEGPRTSDRTGGFILAHLAEVVDVRSTCRRRRDLDNARVAEECGATAKVHVAAEAQRDVDIGAACGNLDIQSKALPAPGALQIFGLDPVLEHTHVGADHKRKYVLGTRLGTDVVPSGTEAQGLRPPRIVVAMRKHFEFRRLTIMRRDAAELKMFTHRDN